MGTIVSEVYKKDEPKLFESFKALTVNLFQSTCSRSHNCQPGLKFVLQKDVTEMSL